MSKKKYSFITGVIASIVSSVVFIWIFKKSGDVGLNIDKGLPYDEAYTTIQVYLILILLLTLITSLAYTIFLSRINGAKEVKKLIAVFCVEFVLIVLTCAFIAFTETNI